MSDKKAREAFEKTKINDKRKNDWAKANGYKMIRIRYDETIVNKLEKELLAK